MIQGYIVVLPSYTHIFFFVVTSIDKNVCLASIYQLFCITLIFYPNYILFDPVSIGSWVACLNFKMPVGVTVLLQLASMSIIEFKDNCSEFKIFLKEMSWLNYIYLAFHSWSMPQPPRSKHFPFLWLHAVICMGINFSS